MTATQFATPFPPACPQTTAEPEYLPPPPAMIQLDATCQVVAVRPQAADAPLISDAEIEYWENLADELDAERRPVKIKKMRAYHD